MAQHIVKRRKGYFIAFLLATNVCSILWLYHSQGTLCLEGWLARNEQLSGERESKTVKGWRWPTVSHVEPELKKNMTGMIGKATYKLLIPQSIPGHFSSAPPNPVFHIRKQRWPNSERSLPTTPLPELPHLLEGIVEILAYFAMCSLPTQAMWINRFLNHKPTDTSWLKILLHHLHFHQCIKHQEYLNTETAYYNSFSRVPLPLATIYHGPIERSCKQSWGLHCKV